MGFVLAGVPNVRRQSQGRFPAAQENLLVVNLMERGQGISALKLLGDETDREAQAVHNADYSEARGSLSLIHI